MSKVEEYIDEAFRVGTKRKRNRPEIIKIIKNYDKCKKRLLEYIKTGNYKPIIHKAKVINDGFKLKKRIIIQPYFTPNKPEQWIQHIVVQVLKPFFMKGMYEFSCGSVPNRGVHYGKKYLEKFIKENPKKIKYVLKADIHHFYENINTNLIKDRLKKYIKDEKFLELVYFILDSNAGYLPSGEIYRPGLPIGFYTSQWFANWFLQPFDHYIKEELRADFYMRYMDDIVIFSSNKRQLKKMLFKIDKYLKTLDLELKDNYQIFLFDYTDKNGEKHGRFIDFMGFKFYRNKTTIRKSVFLRARRLAIRLNKKHKISWYDACRMLSYMGWFLPTDTFGSYKKYIESQKTKTDAQQLLQKCIEDLQIQLSQTNVKYNEQLQNGKLSEEEENNAKALISSLEQKLKVLTFIYDNGIQNLKSNKTGLFYVQ